MADLEKTEHNPKEQLWDEIDDVTAVMLGSPDPMQHMQPMGAMVARDEERIWFFTRIDSDIVKAAGVSDGPVHLCVASEDGDYHACLRGRITVQRSKPHIDRFWSSVVEAWYEDGKDDANLTMICFEPIEARAWASSGNPLKFGWEIAKANLTGSEPDVGRTANINFARAA